MKITFPSHINLTEGTYADLWLHKEVASKIGVWWQSLKNKMKF